MLCNHSNALRVALSSGLERLVAAGLLLLAGCTGTPAAVDLAAGDPDAAALQIESLGHVYYRDTPMPPMPDAAEAREAARRISAARPWERELLTALYPEAPSLWALAIRDTDADGIKDYRVSDYYGRFLEGDTDVDGDGVANVLDAEPYTPSPPVDDALPAPVRWTGGDKPADVQRIQEALYRDHGILLIERSADFTPELARATFDVVTRVYRGVFEGQQRMPTLRVVATEESSLLYADAEEGAGDFAQVLPATQTLEIYRPGIDAPPVIQLGFLAHELGHNLQFAMDYDDAERWAIVIDNFAAAPRFHELMRRFGWDTVAIPDDETVRFELFRPQYVAPEPWEYQYLGKSLAAWEDWLATIYEEVGKDRYLTDDRIVSAHVLGDYSLSDPWEWYSDHLIAYVYLALFDALRADCEDSAVDAAEESLQRDVVAAYWPDFRFANARGAPFQSYLDEMYPLAPADAAQLAARYLSLHIDDTCASW
jgi:hypothetical protein